MGDETIEIIENDETIEIIENDETIQIIENSVISRAYVDAGEKLYFNGQGGDCYRVYNVAEKRLETYVEGTLSDWVKKPGSVGDPFA